MDCFSEKEYFDKKECNPNDDRRSQSFSCGSTKASNLEYEESKDLLYTTSKKNYAKNIKSKEYFNSKQSKNRKHLG